MPITEGLCDECSAKTYVRNWNACLHNADKSVEWWEAYWGREIERQIKLVREHCHGRTDHTAVNQDD